MATVSGDQLWIVDDDKEIARWGLWAVRVAVAIAALAVAGPTLLAVLVAPSLEVVAALVGNVVGLYIVYKIGLYLLASKSDD